MNLTLDALKIEIAQFIKKLELSEIESLYGVTDGKAIGTFVEHHIHQYLQAGYAYEVGSSAIGIDFPDLMVDLKVTSKRQPQSSCPFRSASQKVYGLGYHLLVLVYEKYDEIRNQTARLTITDAVFIDKLHTADYQTTRGIQELLSRDANEDDIFAFLEERNLPLDDIGRLELARRILDNPPLVGYLTVSNALQWRLQYGRVLSLARNQTIGAENLMDLLV